MRDSNVGSDSDEAISAFAGAMSVANAPGYNGHVIGALNFGDVSLRAIARIAIIICADIAQWCAPLRRQHAGKRASSLCGRTADSGPSAKKNINQVENARRI